MDAIWCWVTQHPQLVSATIATLAFFVALWQLASARAHNRRTVRPLLSLEQVRTQNRDDDGNALPSFKIFLRNAGLGPAIIRYAEVSIKHGERRPFTNEVLTEVCDHLLPTPRPKVVTHELRRETVVAKDQSMTVLAFEANTAKEGASMFTSLDKFSFQTRIYYESVHGELFMLDNSDRYSRQRSIHRLFGWILSGEHRKTTAKFGSEL
ncbi:MAG: hypothetical protein EAZ24_02605 [Burkholderiales bacterium]|nr:MAG: hypothetical protein EAZ21_11795 [Betaproteobacteria bacterium]TAG83775.1 MAG: hypothetical protein EAZ24_02605 [Burkholderiales bacterium]